MVKKRIAALSLTLFAPLLLGLLLFDTFAPSHSAHAAPAAAPIVNTLVDENDGCGLGDCSLREAIAAATAGDTITFNVAGTIVVSPILGDLNIGKNLTIDGGGVITVSGNNAVRVFNITAGNVTFDSLTIANGNVQTGDCGSDSGLLCGGGVILQNSDVAVTINNSTLYSNSADYGGGIYTDFGTLTVTNSTLYNNLAANNGGGIYNEGESVTLNNSTLYNNSADTGGGIYNDGESVTIINSTLSGNSADDGGAFTTTTRQ